MQKKTVRKYYDEYLVEEARFDVLKEKVLRGMHEFVDSNTLSKNNQNESSLPNDLSSEVGGMNTEIVSVQPMENVQNGIRF